MTAILIAEDERSLGMALVDDLRLEGYDVELVSDGESAIGRAFSAQFDLVILDVMLPLRDGLEVCRRLRRAGNPVPIILLTARSEESDKVMGLESGADDYVTKPFSPRELRARIKAVLRRGTAAAPVLRFGEVEIDFDRQLVRRSGTPVSLTPIELKLLSVLIHAHGRVLARQQLIDSVWGSGTFVTDRVIDTHMANLRKKLEPQPSRPRYLICVRGSGYRFDE